MRGPGLRPDFFILPTKELNRQMIADHRAWKSKTGGQRPRNPESKHAALFESRAESFLIAYRDKWKILGLKLAIPSSK